MKKMNDQYKPDEIIYCCLCGKRMLYLQGRNPWPLGDTEDDYCCPRCTVTKVVPSRWKLIND